MASFEDEIYDVEQMHLPYRFYRLDREPGCVMKAVRRAFGLTESVMKSSDGSDYYDTNGKSQEEIDQDYLDFRVNTGGIFAQRPLLQLVQNAREHGDTPDDIAEFRRNFIGVKDSEGRSPLNEVIRGKSIDDRIAEAIFNKGHVFGDHAYIMTQPMSGSRHRKWGANDLEEFSTGLADAGDANLGNMTYMPEMANKYHLFPMNSANFKGGDDFFEKEMIKKPVTYTKMNGVNWKDFNFLLKLAMWNEITPLIASKYGGLKNDRVRRAAIQPTRSSKHIYQTLSDNNDKWSDLYRRDVQATYNRSLPEILAIGRAIGQFLKSNGLKGGTPTFIFNEGDLGEQTDFSGYVSPLGMTPMRPIMVLNSTRLDETLDYPYDTLYKYYGEGAHGKGLYHAGALTVPGLSTTPLHEGMHVLQEMYRKALEIRKRLGLIKDYNREQMALNGTGLTTDDLRRGIADSIPRVLNLKNADDLLDGELDNLYRMGTGEYYGGGSHSLDEIMATLYSINMLQDPTMGGIGDVGGKLFSSQSDDVSGDQYKYIVSGPLVADNISELAFDMPIDQFIKKVLLNYIHGLYPDGHI